MALQGLMTRTVPAEEWQGNKAWALSCPRCHQGQAVGVKAMPRAAWGDGLGAHDTIRHILALQGSCTHVWHALVGEDERRVLFYFAEESS
jgi:hypothetical protein